MEENFGEDDLTVDLEELGENTLDMMQIPMPLDIPFPGGAAATGSTASGAASAAPGSATGPIPSGETEFAHVMKTDDLIDYSSSSHIRQRGMRRALKVAPVARYFPLVPPPSYSPPGNNIKSAQQQLALKLAFLRNPHPTREDIVEMALRYGLTSNEITAWFKGERHRFKKKGGIVIPGNAGLEAWQMAMEDVQAPRTRHRAVSTKVAEERAERAGELRRLLTPSQLKRSRAWAEDYANVMDSNEREFRIAQLVDRQDVRLKKEFRGFVVQEPSLGLRLDQEFKARKSCADPTCGREVVAERADSCWEFMRSRFGSTMFSFGERYVDNEGNILLDASLLSGLEMMFMRHRDYLMALVHRFNIREFFEEAAQKRPRTDEGPPDVKGDTATLPAQPTTAPGSSATSGQSVTL
ncbi:hypothetical protein LEN26_012422 [Aphanomyces euteiches]|nr:hypothetical protein LEN26_012422 [Aphanomyces euteiches]KAH9129505.1 hypothetical protein AeMF1_000432 [Aphanomyces euteiches]KAH9190888.1 hypothetical protein AeNC1_007144 [Aphanomyces euteiches]